MPINFIQRRRDQLAGRIQIIKVDAHLHVIAPYSERFIEAAKKLKGQWRPAVYAWVFPESKRSSVHELVNRIYGGKHARCSHRLLKVEGGVRCMYCGMFKERSL